MEDLNEREIYIEDKLDRAMNLVKIICIVNVITATANLFFFDNRILTLLVVLLTGFGMVLFFKVRGLIKELSQIHSEQMK